MSYKTPMDCEKTLNKVSTITSPLQSMGGRETGQQMIILTLYALQFASRMNFENYAARNTGVRSPSNKGMQLTRQNGTALAKRGTRAASFCRAVDAGGEALASAIART